MSIRREATIVEFDATGAVEAASEAADLRLAVVFTDESFETVYADSVVTALYDDEASMRDHFAEIHDYVGIDFAERDLFEELFRGAGAVRATTTHMEDATVTRVLVGEREGVLFVLDPSAPVGDVLRAVRNRLDA